MEESTDFKILERLLQTIMSQNRPKELFFSFVEYLKFVQSIGAFNDVALNILNEAQKDLNLRISIIAPVYQSIAQNDSEKLWRIASSPVLGNFADYSPRVSVSFLQIDKVKPLINGFHDKLIIGILNPKKSTLIYHKLDSERGLLYIGDLQIEITKGQANTMRLLKTLAEEPDRFWFVDEVIEDWEGKEWNEIKDRIPRTRVYTAARKINEITGKMGVEDFLEYTTKKFRINPRYL